MSDQPVDLLAEGEKEAIVMALARARGARGKGFTAAHAARALSWANATRMESAMLDLIIKGLVDLDVKGTTVSWSLNKERIDGDV